jgi:HD superfamily phosphohydrolase
VIDHVDGEALRRELSERAPNLWSQVVELASRWMTPAFLRLDRLSPKKLFPKTINDPIWGSIDLLPWEALLLDTPLIQRLRGVRQLAMAHQVYPSATHTRHAHSLGVVHASSKMMEALERNAGYRREYGIDRDANIPGIDHVDRVVVRLAGLLHDIGHGPFSHATEPLMRATHLVEFAIVDELLRKAYPETSAIQTSEALAALIILSPMMQRFLRHPKTLLSVKHSDVAVAIVARIIGSSAEVSAGYLSNIISGPLDADKLDYMARDSHHSGLPLGLDLDRLISKLEVIVVTEQNAPTAELREEVRAAPKKTLYLIGISVSGLAAYEQMIISRVFLYDRLYYHHKVRAAEAMMRELFFVASQRRNLPFALGEIIQNSDESFVTMLDSDARQAEPEPDHLSLAEDLVSRRIFKRALTLAERFIGGIEGLPAEHADETRTIIWNSVLTPLSSEDGSRELARQIHQLACRISEKIPGCELPSPQDVIIDMPPDKVVVRASRILTRAEGGELQTPNLHFNPERWSGAYQKQKYLGFVYAREDFVPVIAFSARAILFDRFGLILTDQALRFAKVHDTDWSKLTDVAERHALTSADFLRVMRADRPVQLKSFTEEEIARSLPDAWRKNDPQLARLISEGLNNQLPVGVVAQAHREFLHLLGSLARFVGWADGNFVAVDDLSEKELQRQLRQFLTAAELDVTEGAEVGGGESDLIANGFVIENKVRDRTSDPFAVGRNYEWQERRYSIAINSAIGFVCLAYRPSSEEAILPHWQRIRVTFVGSAEARAQIRVAIPYGHPRPSGAKSPESG